MRIAGFPTNTTSGGDACTWYLACRLVAHKTTARLTQREESINNTNKPTNPLVSTVKVIFCAERTSPQARPETLYRRGKTGKKLSRCVALHRHDDVFSAAVRWACRQTYSESTLTQERKGDVDTTVPMLYAHVSAPWRLLHLLLVLFCLR